MLYKERGGSCIRGLVVIKARGDSNKLPLKSPEEEEEEDGEGEEVSTTL